MPDFSIVILVKGRRKQLANLLDSIKASTLIPADIQIVCMDKLNDFEIPEDLNVKIHYLNNEQDLPLAAARNKGFASAKTDTIIFIDVDCIVSPTLFENLLENLCAKNIVTAYPLYLSFVPDSGNYEELRFEAIPHPDRQQIPFGEPVLHLLFWSLIFAVKKQTFEKIGGFDETFTGYGAEDTDFAMMFHQAGIELMFVKDFILHQYHDKYDPPLNYFKSIIKNAKRYHQKWKVLPMRKWLRAFESLGLIKIEEDDQITLIHQPTAKQIKESISPDPY